MNKLIIFTTILIITFCACNKNKNDLTKNYNLSNLNSTFTIAKSNSHLEEDVKKMVSQNFSDIKSLEILDIKYYEVQKYTFAIVKYKTEKGEIGMLGYTNAPLDKISKDKKTVNLTNLNDQLSKAMFNYTNSDGVTYTFSCSGTICCQFEIEVIGTLLQAFSCGCDQIVGADGNCTMKYEGKTLPL